MLLFACVPKTLCWSRHFRELVFNQFLWPFLISETISHFRNILFSELIRVSTVYTRSWSKCALMGRNCLPGKNVQYTHTCTVTHTFAIIGYNPAHPFGHTHSERATTHRAYRHALPHFIVAHAGVAHGCPRLAMLDHELVQYAAVTVCWRLSQFASLVGVLLWYVSPVRSAPSFALLNVAARSGCVLMTLDVLRDPREVPVRAEDINAGAWAEVLTNAALVDAWPAGPNGVTAYMQVRTHTGYKAHSRWRLGCKQML